MNPSARYQSSVAPAKTVIARDFGAASKTYNPAARLQRYMGQVMVDRIQRTDSNACNSKPSVALDLGCGTGWFTRDIGEKARSAKTVGVDLAPGMLQFARSACPSDLIWVSGDAEALPLADNSVDLVFSNLMIQWTQNPDQVLAECRRVLRPGGQLMVSTLLQGTLEELREAWRKADPEHQHVNRFDSAEAYQTWVAEQLPDAEFHRESIRLEYPTPMALLAELKAIGAGFKGSARRASATAPGRLRSMCRHYPKVDTGQIVATYEAAWVFCRLPD